MEKTHEKYLPPIPAKVTDTSTILKYLRYLQKLVKSVNLDYHNIVEDIGAATPASKVIWNYPQEFANIIISPGCFHMMKENFQVTFHKSHFTHYITISSFSQPGYSNVFT